ncbi:MAG: hypothetical protein JXB88_01695 [Spirochaetales bacterium]|nr:hypothetical protein [Spirochaetales bacterium]
MDTIIIAISSIVTAIATGGLMIFAIVQWRVLKVTLNESSKARSAQVLLKIYDIMQNLRPKWHELYNLNDDFRKWNKKNNELADLVGTELQRVAYLTKDLIDKDYIIEGYGKVFINCFNKLKNYIKDYRIKSGENPELKDGGYQRKHFELFAKECEKHFKELSFKNKK